MYMQETTSIIILMCLYVAGLLVTRSNKTKIIWLKDLVMSEFEMTKLGIMFYFLRMKLFRTSGFDVAFEKICW